MPKKKTTKATAKKKTTQLDPDAPAPVAGVDVPDPDHPDVPLPVPDDPAPIDGADHEEDDPAPVA